MTMDQRRCWCLNRAGTSQFACPAQPPRLARTLKLSCALGAMALLLMACSNPGTATDTACIAFGPIYPSRQDTQGTKDQIAVHNGTGMRLCGWEPSH